MISTTTLPKNLKFPGGYQVKVKLGKWGEKCSNKKCGSHFTEGDRGEYCSSAATITLWEGLTPKQKWEVLAHEYIHAWVDWQWWLKQSLERRQ